MANGLLSPVEQQTQAVFGMVPMEERLSILPRYSSTQGLIAPQFIYDLARAVSSPITAMRGQQVYPEESLNVGMNVMGGSSIGSAPRGALRSGFLKDQGSIKPTGLLGVPMAPAANNQFNIVARDASDIFGAGAQRVMYTDPNSGGFIDVLVKPDKTASVMNLLVPEKFRGQKIGESLQAQALKDFPELSGQVSKKAAAKTAYRLGRRPPYMPDASLDDVFKIIDENSSVNLVSPEMQKRFK